MSVFYQHLRDPEYMHVLLNPLPVYGLTIAVIGLALALVFRSQPAITIALALVFISGISAWPVLVYGQAGYDRIKSMSDAAGEQWLDEHMARGEKLIYTFYFLAALAAGGVVLPLKWPRSALPLAGVTLALGATTLGMGGYIAYAGGHIRHREFRFEPPPVTRAEDHHHGDEHQHGEHKPEGSLPVQPEHAGHEGMQQPQQSPNAEVPKSEEEQKQLEASRLQLEASRLQLEASKKQLEATAGASPGGSPSANGSASPTPEHHEQHPPR